MAGRLDELDVGSKPSSASITSSGLTPSRISVGVARVPLDMAFRQRDRERADPASALAPFQPSTASSRVIEGVPMKSATNTLAGRS